MIPVAHQPLVWGPAYTQGGWRWTCNCGATGAGKTEGETAEMAAEHAKEAKPMAAPVSNVGKWDRWYAMLGSEPEPYCDTETYRIGAEWLAGLRVADWGCGKGWMRRFVPPELYYAVDGSKTPFADEYADLATYRRQSEGVFMRHVLEHDWRWELILDNALAAFTRRMCLVLFTPPSEGATFDMEWEPDPGVPNLSFAPADIEKRLGHVTWTKRTAGGAKYGPETLYMIERS